MPIRERGGEWHYRFKVQGHEYTGSTDLAATERNRAAAQRIEAKNLELVLSGRAHELRLQICPFSEAADAFLVWAKGEYRDHPNSEKRLRTSFTSLKLFFGKSPVSVITVGRVKDFMSWRRTPQQAQDGTEIPPVKEITLRHDLHALSKAYQYWMDQNWSRSNPVECVDIPSDEDAVRMHVLTDAEERLYFGTAQLLTGERVVKVKASRRSKAHDQVFRSDYTDLVDVARLMLEQGCRPEEMMRLEKSHIDLAAGKMRIVRGKSKAARRALKLTNASRDVLVRRVADDRSARWVFPSRRKLGAAITSVQKAHDRVCEESGLSFVIYDLRHTFATRAAEGGMAPAVLAAILGHVDLRSIRKYVHVRDEAMDRAMEEKEQRESRPLLVHHDAESERKINNLQTRSGKAVN